MVRVHKARNPLQTRNVDSLRRKHSALSRTAALIVDPTILPEVRKANAILENITDRADFGEAAEFEDEYAEDHNDETAHLNSMSMD